MKFHLTPEQLEKICDDFKASFSTPSGKEMTMASVDEIFGWLMKSKSLQSLYNEMQYDEKLSQRRATADIIFCLALRIATAEVEARKKFDEAYNE